MISLRGAVLFVITLTVLITGGVSNRLTNTHSQAAEPAQLEAATDIAHDVSSVEAAYGKLPIRFEPNVGQTADEVRFVARGAGYSLFLTQTDAVLSLVSRSTEKGETRAAVVKMRIDGADRAAPSTGLDETAGKSNYFIGNDPDKWHAEVPNYGRVRYDDIYKGIDVVYYGNNQQLEYDFVVAPEADPGQIKLRFEGARRFRVEKTTGDLLLETGAGTLRQHRPVVYQNIEGERKEIAGSYSVTDKQVGFTLGEYDRSRELVIDPILVYGSYLGGDEFDEGRSIAVDAQGNAYVVGTSASLDFPTTAGTIKPALLSSTNGQIWYDAFVAKVDPTGTALVFSTYFGGRNGSESGGGVALDADGNILVSGSTMANDLPLVNAYQTTFGGTDDAFAAKINPSGSAIIYSTYLGGNSTESGGRVAVNKTTGDAVFTGYVSSGNFPTTPGAYKPQLCSGAPGTCNGIFYSGGYLVKFSPAGDVRYSTLFTASIADITLDAADNATFAGSVGTGLATTAGAFQPANSGGTDGFIAKMNPSGNALVFATYLGGGLQSDHVRGIELDTAENIYVAGQTENVGFPVTPGALDQTYNGGEDGFVTKLNPAGSSLVYSTFLGGQGKDQPSSIGLGENNDVFIAGETTSGASFPVKNTLNSAGTIFVTRLNADASALVFSTLLGTGGAYDLAVDAQSGAYITGHTTAVLISPNAFQTVRNNNPSNISSKDGFVLKLGPTNEAAAFYNISGRVTDQNSNMDYKPITVTITGTINRSFNLPYSGGQYYFGALPAGGTYTVTARKPGYGTDPESIVFNNLGANQSADFTIVTNHQPVAIITSPAHGTTYNAPASITIRASASDEDGDAIQKVDFVAYSSSTGSIPLGTDTTAPYEFTWTNVPVGTWSLGAYPTDSKGLRGISTPIVHVFVVDPAPVSVSFTTPTQGQTFVEGSYIPIGFSVSSSVTNVQVRDQNNNIVGWLNGSPWTTTWRVINQGTYILTATAQNSQGQTATAGPITITVGPINHRITGKVIDNFTSSPISGVALSLVSPNDPSITASTTTDNNGDYEFTNLGTTPNDGAVITPSMAGYTFDPPTRDIGYLGYVEHWQHQTFIATRQTSINVALTSPTNGQTFTAPATINLTAEASTGSGTIAKVEFFRGQNAAATLIGTDTAAPYEFQWSNAAAGNYELYARATDSTGSIQDSDIAAIVVSPAASTVRLQGDITNPGGGWMPGTRVVLTGTANGSPISQTSISNTFGAYGFFNLPAGGDYTITPQATTITYTPVSVSFTNVTVDDLDVDFVSSAANQSPTVQITSPVPDAVYTMPAAIPVSAVATDADGQIVRVTMSAVNETMSTTIGQALGGSFSALWQPNQPGNYTIWANAVDNGGLQTSVSIHITVNPPAPVSITGRAVERNSVGIADAIIELHESGNGEPIVATATTDGDGNYSLTGITTFKSYILKAVKESYSFSPQYRNYFNLSTTQTGVNFTGTLQTEVSDFDGDGRSDLAVWRPSTGVWYVSRSADSGYSASQFGGGAFGDVVVPGNYDGDKKVDYGVFRNGVWYIQNSSNSAVRVINFGLAGDKPVPADYDGDGKTDIAVWRPGDGIWYILQSSDGSYVQRPFGTRGDISLAADYDGDGMADLAIWRPGTGTWYISESSTGSAVVSVFGTIGDMPVAGDFDGDKRADIALFRPSDGNWYLIGSATGAAKAVHWGAAGDKPVPGDYDRDGQTDMAVYRDSDRTWYIVLSSSGQYIIRQFGLGGDIPIPAAYIR